MQREIKIPVNASNIVSEGYAYGILRCIERVEVSSEKTLIEIGELKKTARMLEEKIKREYGSSDVLGEIGEVHIMVLNDPLLWDELEKKAREKGGKLSIKDIMDVRDYIISLLLESGNPLIQERQYDIKDLFNALLSGAVHSEISNGDIVYVDELYPSDVVVFHNSGVGAILSKKGSPTAHASILAQALEIPYIYGIPPLDDYCGMRVFVDAVHGEVRINPSNIEGIKAIIKKYEAEKQNLEKYSKMKFEGIEVMANIGFLQEIDVAKKKGADGVGLFRTEFLFLNRREPPSEDEQFLVYKKVLEAFSPDRVIIRLLDVGGDKSVSYLKLPEESNPFLGVRGVRALMKNDGILKTQLRALIRASAYGNLGILIPMVSKPEDVIYVRKLIKKISKSVESHGNFTVGIMVEVPSVVFSIDKFVQQIDFASIGTNDLTQYIFAADRMNPEVSEYYNDQDDAVLAAIKIVAEKMRESKKPVGICGELAGKREMISKLMSFGVTSFSVAPAKVPRIKKAVYEALKET
ncbi:phosphoenolpyruvate--protein phosphotransferase [Palaeococcus sp. (in: euryarchaeotes)]